MCLNTRNIYVTQPAIPPLEEFVPYLEEIWASRRLTNQGKFHEQFERELAEYLGVKYVSLFCNGMIALQVGLQALKITGEVITTPYSFPATTHALWWSHCQPVFCDIDPVTCNLDPSKLESLITPRTTAIFPVHVYGTPCDVDSIQRIADIYGLKVFYDAAHAFGVRVNGESVLNFGDLSMLSFHATKVFNTAEGGALITNDSKLKERIDFLKNFGFANETTVVAPGTNGKMNEIQAALGIVQLKHVDNYINKRLKVVAKYRELLADVPGVRMLEQQETVLSNGAYFPIFVDEAEYGMSRDSLYDKLKEHGINGRRYFYPLISSFPLYRGLISAKEDKLTVANKMSSQVICLPCYPDLSEDDVHMIVKNIKEINGITPKI